MMHNIQQILSDAVLQCRDNGSRLTDKRKKVLNGLQQSKRALSAYELVEYCNETYHEKFAAMSVYRIWSS